MPAAWIRRLTLAPAVVILSALVVTTLPLSALVAAALSPFLPGRWRPLRLLLFALVYLVVDALAVLACAAMWVAAGFGRHLARPAWQERHHALLRLMLRVLVATAHRAFNLRFDLDLAESVVLPDPGGGTDHDRPVLVLARHAGPGDSFLLVHALTRLGRRPRIVLRDTLRWDPAIDLLLGRLPTAFIGHDDPPGTGTRAIARLAATMGPRDALVIFPEGRNFTPGRRTRSIAALEEDGDHAAAERARALRHVLQPRTGGTRTAIAAAPDADVVFVAHTGLEDLSTVVDLWRGLPMDAEVAVKAWRVPTHELPRHREETASWLTGWWRRIDAWILQRYGAEALPDAAVDAAAHEQPPPER